MDDKKEDMLRTARALSVVVLTLGTGGRQTS